MHFKWYHHVVVLGALAIFSTSESCPTCPETCVCHCANDEYNTICIKGGLRSVPINAIDVNTTAIIIRGPRNNIHIGQIFNPLKHLHTLRITDSNVPAIGLNSFWGVQSLRILDLSRNNITQITDVNFRGQDGLLELDLSTNKIHRLPSAVFYHLQNLTRLNLADNSIGELSSRLFLKLTKLIRLDISGNPLVDLPPEVFRDITELKILRCRRCMLDKINVQVYNLLPRLQTLDLGDNELKYLDKDEFIDLKRLAELRLDGNRISVIVDNLFVYQTQLKYLDLSRNILAKISNGAFAGLTNLTALDVSYNKLGTLDSTSVRPLHSLISLNVSGNVQIDVDRLAQTFKHLPLLQTLFVADIGPLPVAFLRQLTQLRHLNLSGNHADSRMLPILNHANSLQMLDLSRNQLNGFDESIAIKLHKIHDVYLNNNPIICDKCHMGLLIDLAASISWRSLPKCFLPANLRGIVLSNLTTQNLSNCLDFIEDEDYGVASTSHNIHESAQGMVALVSAMALAIVAAAFLLCNIYFARQRARYYTNEDKRLESHNETICLDSPLRGEDFRFTFPVDIRDSTLDDFVHKSFPPEIPTKTST